MNKNILIVLGGAVLAAILVAVLVQVTLGGKKEPVEAPENAVKVLVAAKDLKKGRKLEEGDMKWKVMAEDTLFRGAITQDEDEKPEDALEGRLERSFYKDEAMVKRGILKESKANYVIARLKPGERAVSIKVSAEDMVAGFIAPGSFVDVILTYKHRISIDSGDVPQIENMLNMNIDNLATETIMQNVRVLAIDQKANKKEDDKIKVGKTVTLAVSSRDAETLALASEMGTLTLSMRGVGDDAANAEAETLTDARLTKIDNEIKDEYDRLKEDTGVTTNVVKIYNGAQVDSIPVR